MKVDLLWIKTKFCADPQSRVINHELTDMHKVFGCLFDEPQQISKRLGILNVLLKNQ